MLRRSLLLAGLGLLALAGCSKHKPRSYSVQEVADALKAGTLHAFDANMPEFREKNGIVPGATLLADHDGYDPKETLPADKAGAIVFYCSGRL